MRRSWGYLFDYGIDYQYLLLTKERIEVSVYLPVVGEDMKHGNCGFCKISSSPYFH
jgi:hypothetical protein